MPFGEQIAPELGLDLSQYPPAGVVRDRAIRIRCAHRVFRDGGNRRRVPLVATRLGGNVYGRFPGYSLSGLIHWAHIGYALSALNLFRFSIG